MLQELTACCTGQIGLAVAFRHLQLRRLFPPTIMQDDRDDRKCASVLAAIFGELIDAPLDGESPARENARQLAQWAVLDYIWFLGAAKLAGGPSPAAGGAAPSDAFRDGFGPGGLATNDGFGH